MFRKVLPIFAFGLGILALGAVKSEAQAPTFLAVVGASVINSQGQKVDYTIHDWIGVDGGHYIMVTYVNEKTHESGTATETSIGTSGVSSTGAAYSGSMLVGKNWRNFSLSLDATTPSVSFNLAGAKGSAAISSSNVLAPGSYSIYLNP